MSRTYGWYWCGVCGKWITSAGAARVSHLRKHVREGKVNNRNESHINFEVVRGVPWLSWKKS